MDTTTLWLGITTQIAQGTIPSLDPDSMSNDFNGWVNYTNVCLFYIRQRDLSLKHSQHENKIYIYIHIIDLLCAHTRAKCIYVNAYRFRRHIMCKLFFLYA